MRMPCLEHIATGQFLSLSVLDFRFCFSMFSLSIHYVLLFVICVFNGHVFPMMFIDIHLFLNGCHCVQVLFNGVHLC